MQHGVMRRLPCFATEAQGGQVVVARLKQTHSDSPSAEVQMGGTIDWSWDSEVVVLTVLILRVVRDVNPASLAEPAQVLCLGEMGLAVKGQGVQEQQVRSQVAMTNGTPRLGLGREVLKAAKGRRRDREVQGQGGQGQEQQEGWVLSVLPASVSLVQAVQSMLEVVLKELLDL